jgi:hypothetical protein
LIETVNDFQMLNSQFSVSVALILSLASLLHVASASFYASIDSRFLQGFHPLMMARTPQAAMSRFKVRIENRSRPAGFVASNGTQWTLTFSPGVWVLHDRVEPLFARGEQDWGLGFEAIAEEGNPIYIAKALRGQAGVIASGVFDTAIKAKAPGSIGPGQAFEFTVRAALGQRLSFVTRFAPSNDWFYAPTGEGIALFDSSRKPIQGDVTAQVFLWDNGTELDEEPGSSSTQQPRQKELNQGIDENGVVQRITKAPFAEVSPMMRVTITPLP